MTRVLLTGATGFVGRQVLRALRAQGAEVVAVLREGRDLSADLAGVVRSADLFAEDAAAWRRACAGIDAVVHVAWYAEPGKYQHSPRNLDCLAGSLRLAQGAAAAGVRRFVGIGTCFEYDLEGIFKPLSPDARLAPRTPYGAAKAATYLALSRALPGMGVSFAWCRLFYLYGAGEDPRRLVPHIHARLARGEPAELTSGRQVRDFMDVTEAGNQIAAVTLGAQVDALNICSGQPVTVADLAARIADEYGRPDLIRLGARADPPDDPPYVVGVPSLARTWKGR
ncbi:dTDP-6-deoxy-L-talose 4-dehydrogenase (NAD+) [Rhodovulum bhavnagarense]|uniref:dTDP-6-deoxy-L-talose 4-dehydrogenase (NAD+) n=1 Tax=Rhodovulum bhavnagarense TaxID=992286 RepID=A0A4R2RAQ1_9RHOB|nr:NAD(P)-dependent oxidoreductase [Rhodovulum bhavnagarense]TCP59803.1 dTDP-6-deoxy-L-talose 4-dehydrogenase (NAD+) [Rhodovulum bhavnagarense]